MVEQVRPATFVFEKNGKANFGGPAGPARPGVAGYKKWDRKRRNLGENEVGWQFTGGCLEKNDLYRSN